MSKLFLVAKGDQEDLKWVSKAVSTDSMRGFIGHVWYDREEGLLVATDGFREHILNLRNTEHPRAILEKALMDSTNESTFIDYKQGIITVHTASSEYEALGIYREFPNYKRVIPDIGKMEKDTDVLWPFSPKKDKKGTRIMDRTIGLLIAKYHIPLNPAYLYDMAQGSYYFSKARKEPEIHCVTLEDDTGRKAIIMPINPIQ